MFTRFTIDWSEGSTKRGLVWLIASILATILSVSGDRELAMQIFLTGAAVAGLVGMVGRDKQQ